MIYVVLVIAAVLFLWFFSKLSKPACALAGFLGLGVATMGVLAQSASTIMFGGGLFAFSAIVFLAINGGKW